MKKPPLNLLLLAVAMLFASCSKEAIDSPDPIVQPQNAVHTRCCTDDGDIILSNPEFREWLSVFQTGLVEPTLTLFETLDSAYLSRLFADLSRCLQTTGDVYACLEGLDEALYVKNYIEGYNIFMSDSLRQQFPGLTDDEVVAAVVDAASKELLQDQRFPVCFVEYRSKVISLLDRLAIALMSPDQLTQAVAAISFVNNMITARYEYCACLFQHYQASC